MLMRKINQWRASFREAVGSVERESLEYQQARDPAKLELHVFGIIILASVVLSIQEYFGSSNHYENLSWFLAPFMDEPKAYLYEVFRAGERARLYRLFYWVSATVLCYLLLPALYIKLVMRQRLRDFGFSLKGTLKHSWIYIGLYSVVLPALVVVSQTKSFQKTYPFYQNAHLSAFDFLGWEFAYALQFLSLEFFFRGFLVHGLKGRFGYYSIFIAVMPYCMIHFGKPLPETLGAIFAGLALGTLSLFTRSIWLGVAIHVSVAVSMDILSLWAQGKLF